MNELNIYNIPAYQRKKSLAAKSRKSAKNATKAGSAKSSKKRTSKKTKASTELLFSDNLSNIPVRETPPTEDLYQERVEKKMAAELHEWKLCGHIEGYFDKIEVAIIKVVSPIRTGDILLMEKDSEGLFEMKINSMQIDRKDVTLARSGSDIGLKIALKAKVGTPVYKLME